MSAGDAGGRRAYMSDMKRRALHRLVHLTVFATMAGPLLGRDLGQGFADDFFGLAEPVDDGSVDPVDAGVDGFADGGDAIGIVLRPPCERPPAADDRLRPEPDRGDVQVRVAETAGMHERFLTGVLTMLLAVQMFYLVDCQFARIHGPRP